MKKKIFILMSVILIVTTSVFAQENNDLKNGLTLGGGLAIGPNIQGGSIEFGFGLYEKNKFFIRNHIEVNGSLINDNFTSYGFRESNNWRTGGYNE